MAVMWQKNWLIAGVLLLSLVANLFLAGLLLGLSWQPETTASEKVMAEELEKGEPLSRMLPKVLLEMPETHERVKTIMQRNMPLVKDQVRYLWEARQQVRQEMQQDVIDEQALRRAFSHLRLAEAALKETVHPTFIEVILVLTPTERHQLTQQRLQGQQQKVAAQLFALPPEVRAQRILQRRDDNQDGLVSESEFLLHAPPWQQSDAAQRFQNLDLDGNGVLTVEELRQDVEARAERLSD